MLRKALLLPVLAAAVGMGACDSSTSPGSARLNVLLTDAPADYLASATVEIGRIEVIAADGQRTTVTEEGGSYDLLQLQDGVTADLGSVELEPGTYTELRMIVRSAEVTLADGYEFEGGGTTRTIAVPSGAASGIKISLAYAEDNDGSGVEIRPGETFLVVDFDVSSNFVMQGSPDAPAGIKGYNFTPRLRAVVRDVAGSLAGTVTPLELLTDTVLVRATLAGEESPDTASAAVATGDGTFKFLFLGPGTYDVWVSGLVAGQGTSTEQVTVGESEAVTGVALTITAAP